MESPNRIGVLVVDDNEQFITVLKAVLADEPDLLLVGAAENGEEAVQLVRELEPEVVLMDISMPVMSGFEATRRIAAECPDTRVLMVSGSSSEEDRTQAREAGAVGYVQKERILDELSGAIRSAAGGNGLS
jgi:two-component system, NarL family, nitrate/nitrite response regulator NarL